MNSFDTHQPISVHLDLGGRKYKMEYVTYWSFSDVGLTYNAEEFPHQLCFVPWHVVKMIEQMPSEQAKEG